MKKKFLLVFAIIVSLFITGCGKDNSKTTGSTKENKNISDFLIDNAVDTNNMTNTNHFYLFSKDGKFIISNSTEVKFRKPKVVLFIKGSWKLNGNNLTLKHEEIAYQSLDAGTGEYSIEYDITDITEEYKNLKLDKTSNGDQYLIGDECSIFKKSNNNKDFIKEVRSYLNKDIKDVDLKKLKELEAK